jgi:MFS family permease
LNSRDYLERSDADHSGEQAAGARCSVGVGFDGGRAVHRDPRLLDREVALPSIQRSLLFSAVGVEGVITAYATAFGGLLVLGGRLADLLGRRRIFMVGLVAFAATSALCALATSPVFLVCARAAQRIAAALLAPSAMALLTTTFPEGPERNRALGVFGAATAAGFVAGQVLGGC